MNNVIGALHERRLCATTAAPHVRLTATRVRVPPLYPADEHVLGRGVDEQADGRVGEQRAHNDRLALCRKSPEAL